MIWGFFFCPLVQKSDNKNSMSMYVTVSTIFNCLVSIKAATSSNRLSLKVTKTLFTNDFEKTKTLLAATLVAETEFFCNLDGGFARFCQMLWTLVGSGTGLRPLWEVHSFRPGSALYEFHRTSQHEEDVYLAHRNETCKLEQYNRNGVMFKLVTQVRFRNLRVTEDFL